VKTGAVKAKLPVAGGDRGIGVGMLFTSRDHQVMQSVANRVIELLPGGIIDRRESYDEYLEYMETLTNGAARVNH